jgi:hypothetical protein
VILSFRAFQISETGVIQPQNDAASLVDPSEVRLFILISLRLIVFDILVLSILSDY